MLGIILPIVISDFLQHLIDASVVQCSLLATLDIMQAVWEGN
jgi:hypothetical protein